MERIMNVEEIKHAKRGCDYLKAPTVTLGLPFHEEKHFKSEKDLKMWLSQS